MKRIFILAGLFFTFHSFAQKNGKVILNKGQKITATSTSSADTDMGMGMQMKNKNTSVNVLNVIADDNANYSVTNTMTKLNMSMDMMGQQTAFDSEKPADKDSEIGKELSPKINVTDTLLVDKATGDIIKNKKTESPERAEKGDDANPIEGMLGAMGSSADGNAVLSGAFFIVPKDKKAGDSWTDSSSVKNMTSVKTYTIKSIDKNIAIITLKGSVTGNGETEMQGTSVSFSMNTKSTGEMTVDIKNGLVNKITSDADISGTFDVMGQSMPISSKGSSTITYQY